jgi:predicted ATP-grasp superfamily ATP-dependent carboligase
MTTSGMRDDATHRADGVNRNKTGLDEATERAGSVSVMEHVRWTDRPVLRSPVFVCAFTGWNDAGDAASTAVRHLVEAWSGRRFASIDPEEFYDFQSTRPEVRLDEGRTRQVVWPANDLFAAGTAGGDVVLLLGAEPQLRWRTFCRQITAVAHQLQARLVLTLGALLADVPHSRPVSMVGTATNQALIDRFGLARSRYEGPTGIVGVLQDACEGANVPSASLWAAVPAYAAAVPSPKATLALVERTATLIGTPVPVGDLDEAGTQYEQDVDQLVASDEDLSGYVRRMESMADDEEEDDETEVETAPDAEEADPGTAARFVEDIERYLKDQGLE